MDHKSKSPSNTTLNSRDQPTTSSQYQPPDDSDPPVYFDSEPTSQPPAYNKNKPKATSRPWTGPASAASIAAIMGPPPPARQKKMTLRERWKDLMYGDGYTGADAPERGMEGMGSRTTWNVHNAEFLPKEKKKKNG